MLGILGTSKFGTFGNFGISGIGGKLGGVGNLGNPFFSFGFFSTCFFLNFGIGGSLGNLIFGNSGNSGFSIFFMFLTESTTPLALSTLSFTLETFFIAVFSIKSFLADFTVLFMFLPNAANASASLV